MTYSKPRGRIYDSITELVGGTPLVRVNRLAQNFNVKANILAKLEFFNPLASVKDRIAVYIVDRAEQSGLLKPGGTIIEATSGNTGIGLAFVAAARGYRLILTMPESVSLERRKMVTLLGAELVLTPANLDMRGAINKSLQIAEEIEGSVIARQFANEANPEIHAQTTAVEILEDTQNNVDIVVMGVGTGGTLTGVARVLKEKLNHVQIVAIEPDECPLLSNDPHAALTNSDYSLHGIHGLHGIQGIGPGFIPGVLDRELIDEVVKVNTAQALDTARKAARLDGIAVGISSGAALYAALLLGQRPENECKNIVVIVPSFAERYTSTPLFDSLALSQ